jgi:predicted RNase H-like HicB family nuclease
MDYQKISVHLEIDLCERDGCWRARLPQGPPINIDGNTRAEALLKAKAFALRALADDAESEQTTS